MPSRDFAIEIRDRARVSRETPHGRASAPISVVVADGEALDRVALCSLLCRQRWVRVLGAAATVPAAIELCRSADPILLLALGTPGAGDAGPIAAVLSALPRLRVVAISERGSERCLVLNPPARVSFAPGRLSDPCRNGTDCLQLALALGARGAVRRSVVPERLFAAIRGVAGGAVVFEPDGASQNPLPNGHANGTTGAALSPRELEVAALLAEGLSNKEIGEILDIAEPTVKKHVGRLFDKLELDDRLQVGLFLARHPLLLQRSPRPQG